MRAQGLDAGRETLAGAALPDLDSWWAEPGRPGWFPGARDASGAPRTLAGLLVGGVRIEEPGSPLGFATPGLRVARRALTWNDSTAVSFDAGPAWEGYGAPLARLSGVAFPPGRGRAIAVVNLEQGDHGFENDGVGLERSDSTSRLRADIVTGDRGAVGPFERGGHHLWGLSAQRTRGRHHLGASYAQQGAGELLASGEEEEAAGESGALIYRYQGARAWGGAELARADAHHESAGGLFPDRSRRDAGESRAALELGRPLEGGELSARLLWSEAAVTRVTGDSVRTADANTMLWGAVRLERPFGAARARLALGVGRDRASGTTTLAPEGRLAFGDGSLSSSVGIGRRVVPAWSDLAPGRTPFVQSTWAVDGDLRAAGSIARLRVMAIAGRTAGRILIERTPLEEQALRDGVRADPARYRFALGSAAAALQLRAVELGAEGFVLGRDRDPGVVQPDPSWGARLAAGGRFALFQGDLGVTLRGELEWTGERQTEEAVPRPLAAFTSLGAAAVLRLGDATFTLRARNLLDRPESFTWIDPRTGEPARGPGLEVRGALTWRMFD